MSSPGHCRVQKGFSLIEKMFAIGLLAILAALAAPSFNGAIANRRVTAAAQELQALLQLARSEAVYRRTVILVDSSGPVWAARAGQTVLREARLPDEVVVTPALDGGVAFDAMGNAQPAAGRAPYRLSLAASRASRTRCLRVTRAGLVRQDWVAGAQPCP